MTNAAVVGNGMVGNATGTLFNIEKRFDTNEERSNCTLAEVADCRYIFICLPTDVVHGDYNVQPIFEIIKQIEAIKHGAIFIIRSTVWPGFADHVFGEIRPEAVISNPEFLSEDTWEKDIVHPPFVLLGGFEGRFRDEVAALYRGRVKTAPIIETDNKTAELAKITLNAFFSTKVIFSNQVYDYCQKMGANYERVREILEKHPFGMKNHTEIHYRGVRGIRGKCLPKDLEAFKNLTKSPLFEVVERLNEEYIH